MIINGFLLGLSSGVFCIGYCYPVLMPLVFSQEHYSFTRTVFSIGIFLSGRLIAYLFIGFACGIIGSTFSNVAVHLTRITPFLYGGLALFLIAYGVASFSHHHRWCRFTKKNMGKSFFLTGLVTGMHLCPPFLVAITLAVSFSDLIRSMLYFLSFFIATALFMVPLFILSPLSRIKEVRIANRIIAVVCGLWFLYRAVRMMSGGA